MNELRSQLREQMFGLVREYEDSKVSKKIFCEHHNLSQWKFFYWQQKYHAANDPGSENSGKKFIRVNTGQEKNKVAQMVIYYPNGVRVELEAGMGLSDVRTLIGV